MKSVIVFLLMYFALGAIPQATTPNGGVDITGLANHIQYLEQSLSHIESNAKTQEQKYAAVLSSVLSKLTTTTDELSNVKSDIKTLEANHKATKAELATVKAELESTQKELKLLADSAERNISTCVLELERARDDHNASGLAFTALGTAIVGLTSEVNVSESSVTLIKSDVTNLRIEVEEVERDLNSSQVVTETTQRKLEALSVEHEGTNNDVKKLQHDIRYCQGQKIADDCKKKFKKLNDQYRKNRRDVKQKCGMRQKIGNHVAFQEHLNVTAKVSSTLATATMQKQGCSLRRSMARIYSVYADIGVHNIYLYQGQKILARGFTILHHGREIYEVGLASVITVVHLDRQDVVHFATDPTTSQVAEYGHSHYGGALLYAV